MLGVTFVKPGVEIFGEVIIGEIIGPDGGVFDAGLGERAIEIEHADEAGPGAAPVGSGENGALMREQAGENMMRVLPNGFSDDERRFRVDRAEDFHAFFLRLNEAVLLIRLVRVRANEFVAFALDGLAKGGFHLFLRGPADLICGEAEIATGDEKDLSFADFAGLLDGRQDVGGHEVPQG